MSARETNPSREQVEALAAETWDLHLCKEQSEGGETHVVVSGDGPFTRGCVRVAGATARTPRLAWNHVLRQVRPLAKAVARACVKDADGKEKAAALLRAKAARIFRLLGAEEADPLERTPVSAQEAATMVESGCVPDGRILDLARTVRRLHAELAATEARLAASKAAHAHALAAFAGRHDLETEGVAARARVARLAAAPSAATAPPSGLMARWVARNARALRDPRPPKTEWLCVQAGTGDADVAVAASSEDAAISFAMARWSDGDVEGAPGRSTFDVFVMDPRGDGARLHRVFERYEPDYTVLPPGDDAGARPEPSEEDLRALREVRDDLRESAASAPAPGAPAPPVASADDARAALAALAPAAPAEARSRALAGMTGASGPPARPRPRAPGAEAVASLARGLLAIEQRYESGMEYVASLLLRCHAAATGEDEPPGSPERLAEDVVEAIGRLNGEVAEAAADRARDAALRTEHLAELARLRAAAGDREAPAGPP